MEGRPSSRVRPRGGIVAHPGEVGDELLVAGFGDGGGDEVGVLAGATAARALAAAGHQAGPLLLRHPASVNTAGHLHTTLLNTPSAREGGWVYFYFFINISPINRDWHSPQHERGLS